MSAKSSPLIVVSPPSGNPATCTGLSHPNSGRVLPVGKSYGTRLPSGHHGTTSSESNSLEAINDLFPNSEEDVNVGSCIGALSQHETEHSSTWGQTSANAVIKAEARLANALIKAITPYQSLVNDMVQEVRTLSSLEDIDVLRPVALQAMNDFARNTSNLFRCVMPGPPAKLPGPAGDALHVRSRPGQLTLWASS